MQRIAAMLGAVTLAVVTTAGHRDLAADASAAVVDGWPSGVADHGESFIDLWTEATTAVALFGEPRVSGTEVADISVRADGNHVALHGVVDSPDASRAASIVARGLPGVTSVANELTIEPATAEASRPDHAIAREIAVALRTTRALEGAHIAVAVAGGIVDLGGSVRDVGDWALASRTARAVPGVRAVENHLAMQHAELTHE